ncbi:MAG TPA: hypothetical protein VK116_04510, partial [Planctomycetota bacterium]|nr:hypothetical protein [Planctomycetota bacterium]
RTPERQLFAAARSDDPARFRVLVEDTLVPGLSFLRYRGTGGEADEMHAIAVRSEIEESELARISASDLARLYPDLPITVVEDPSRFSDTGRGRFEAADLFLGAFAVLLFVEGLLALYFAHHRRNSERSANAPSATSATSARAQVTP